MRRAAAMLATIDHVAINQNDRVTWQNGAGPRRWGLSAAEGAFDEYFAFGAPEAALAADGGFVAADGSVMVEAESGTGDGANQFRGNASNATTVQLDAGETRTVTVDLPFKTEYEVVVRYSNDNFGPLEDVEIRVDGNLVGTFLAQDTGDFGQGWDVFVESGPLGPVILPAIRRTSRARYSRPRGQYLRGPPASL